MIEIKDNTSLKGECYENYQESIFCVFKLVLCVAVFVSAQDLATDEAREFSW